MLSKRNNGNIVKATILTVLCLTLGACSKGETVEQEVVQAYPTNIALSDIQQSAANVAVQYANYMRNGYYDAAFDLVYLTAETYYTKDDMVAVDTVAGIGSKYILTDVSATDTAAILTYREKVGEAFTKEKKNAHSEYLGEICTTEKKVVVPIEVVDGTYYIGVSEDFMSQEQIALKVPDGCDVWFGDTLLNPDNRDDNGYYILSNFIAGDFKNVRLTSAIEDRELLLVLNDDADLGEKYANIIVVNADAKAYDGLRSYTYEWQVSRETVNSAVNYSKEVLQILFDDIINGTEYVNSMTAREIAITGNAEQIKPDYLKMLNYYVDTNTKAFSDLTCVDVSIPDEDTMRRRNYVNKLIDRNTMQLRIDVDYSYLSTSLLTNTTTPKTGTVSGYIYLSKENGKWKLSEIDSSLLKNVR